MIVSSVRVAGDEAELLADVRDRQPMKTADSKSGNRFESATVGDRRCVIKHVCVDDDWLMRATGDVAGREILIWSSGLLSGLPDRIETAVIGVAPARQRRGGVLLLEHVGEHLVPEGDDPVPLAQHRRLVADMARLHAAYWGWTDRVGLTPLANRYLMLSPWIVEVEAARGGTDAVPPLVGEGWERYAALVDGPAGQVLDLLVDPSPLLRALAVTPTALVHGDWKMGNLGSRPDGRTILLDWAYVGQGPPLADLVWYLAINAARIPEPRDAVIAAYRSSLEGSGIVTDGWFDEQLKLCLLGGVLQFGWEKALGGPGEELSWWLDRAADGIRRLS